MFKILKKRKKNVHHLKINFRRNIKCRDCTDIQYNSVSLEDYEKMPPRDIIIYYCTNNNNMSK